MKSIWILLLIIFALSIFELGADIYLTKWARKNNNIHLIFGIIIYAIVGLIYGYALKYGMLTIANAFWQIFSIIFVSLIGYFMFKERPSMFQWIGIGIVLIGFIVLLIASVNNDAKIKNKK